jgi:ribonuclease VapC
VIFVADTSALLAVIFAEEERAVFKAIMLEEEPWISAATLVETLRAVQLALGPAALAEVDVLLEAAGAEVVPVDVEQVGHARDGMLRYGKGRGANPAVLNFGDLFAYALAKKLAAPLLFKGDDFRATDVVAFVHDRPGS